MREVLPGLLWIGNARDTRAFREMLSAGITAIVDLAMEEPPTQPPRDIICCRFPLIDGEGNPPALLRIVVQTTASLIRSGLPNLVACGGGMSRSPAVVAGAMASVRTASIDRMLQDVTKNGPHDVSPAFWSELQQAVS